MNRNLTIISGSSHPNFADLVAEQLGFTPHHVLRGKFANGEIRFELLESVRGSDVYVIQTSCSPINDMLMELLIMVQTCRYASANRITAVIPFFPYSRQDKMFSWQQPITAKLVANMLSVAGANHIVTMDLHAAQLQGFFDIPCDNLASIVTLIPWIHRYIPDWHNGVVVAPDNGAVKIATKLRDSLNLPMALIHKQRRHKNARYELVLVGDVHGKVTIVVDDMIDTSNTLCFAAERLKDAGSSKIYAIVTHGIFSGDSIQKLNDSDYELVICTNTIPQAADVAKNPKFLNQISSGGNGSGSGINSALSVGVRTG
ncbi:uncharacterized protein Dwil_GK18441 [Drosophila willistoni]|uniref:ribose-phosphate diphosphokinase n=1 Tax=Drosophila willistoni TaxID=7260 RepID=B4NLN7_DROWI|nr:uncharacterized protein Dwil_GK18441 [Drosophila willistoni]